MAVQGLIIIPVATLAEWKATGFSVYSLIEICGGEEKFYDALFSGRIPEDWARKARASLSENQLILARLVRIEAKLDYMQHFWEAE